MSDRTARLALKKLVDGQEMDAFEVNRALNRLDSLTDVYLKDQFVETPPASPADGDMYLTGGAPTGAWTGQAYKIAYCLDGGWKFRDPFDGLRAFVAASGGFIVYLGGNWLDWSSLISAMEGAIASAATCDIGAQGSLFLQVTGTTAITSLGTGAGKLRFLSFAQALTLTYNATSLILPGAANIVTAPGDCAIFTSDAGGNWRCRSYARADGSGTFTTLCASGAVTVGGGFSTASGTNINPGSLSNFYLSDNVSGNPGVNFDAGDYISYVRAPNVMDFSVGGVVVAQAFSNGFNIGPNNAAFNPTLWLNAPAGRQRQILLRTGGVDRWYVMADATAEGGADAGSNFLIQARHDDGSFAGNALSLNRAGFAATFAAGATFNGTVAPGTDNARNLGSASLRWATVYAGTGTINTSGAATKTAIRAFTDPEMAVAKALAANIRVYQFCDAVAAKGAGAARLHAGMIFEEVVSAFQAQGLDPRRYGIVCEDPAVKRVTTQTQISRQQQKTATVSVPQKTIAIQDGKAIVSIALVEMQQQIFELLPLVDTSGAPVLDADGAALTHQSPVMETVSETVTASEMVPDLDENGQQKTVAGLRYDELAQFVIAGLAARLQIMEARLAAG